MLMASPYDAIIIGTGAGGGTLALQLARAGKNILVLERGGFMPQEKLNWSTSAVFLQNRYHTQETWQDKDGKPLHPQQSYFVGGQTKVYGAAMFRMRSEDFGEIQHQGGISPAWPISYAEMEPFYTQAEELFDVHGDLGSAPPVPGGFGSSFDPTEPFHSRPYPYPAFTNEPHMQTVEDAVRKLGIHTFPIPLGLKLNESDPAGKPVRALRYLRRLSLPGPCQVRCGHQLHPPDDGAAERHADDPLPRAASAHQRERNRGDRGRGVPRSIQARRPAMRQDSSPCARERSTRR